MAVRNTITRTHMVSGLDPLPAYLAPRLLLPFLARPAASPFSTSCSRSQKTGDRNKRRGVSPLRRTGPKKPLSVSNEPLPQPVLDPAKRSAVITANDHGLWGFFTKDKKPMVLPEVEAAHGLSIWSISSYKWLLIRGPRTRMVSRRITTQIIL
jgi:large subunit ribosomal protein L47